MNTPQLPIRIVAGPPLPLAVEVVSTPKGTQAQLVIHSPDSSRVVLLLESTEKSHGVLHLRVEGADLKMALGPGCGAREVARDLVQEMARRCPKLQSEAMPAISQEAGVEAALVEIRAQVLT